MKGAARDAAILILAGAVHGVPAESARGLASPGDLKKLSLEELMDVEVTLVSRQSEPLSEAASAIQVLTREDIRRSGATTLPEALRLASNLHVAQVSANAFAISPRGLNSTSNTPANKLLVMIDGRTVYTPLFAGVFWDVQHLILDNVERIEIISGPGGSVWGANAVNGVINIVTQPAAGTAGPFVEAGVGSFLRDFIAARYGWKGPDIAWRAYGQRLDHNSSVFEDGADAGDAWDVTHGGLRLDWRLSGRDSLMLQGEMMGAGIDQAAPGPDGVSYNAQFLQARWNSALSPTADLQVKAYMDRTWRDVPGNYREDLRTYDIDAYHSFPPFRGNRLLWGAGYRLQADNVENPDLTPGSIQFRPARKDLHLFSAYFQDQQDLMEERLRLTAGMRLEHNDYTEWEVMPTVRAAWLISRRHTAWAAFSRAVRSPSRIDVEAFTPPPVLVTDTTLALEGGPGFDSEKLHAYELGYRIGMAERISLSAAAFVHSYEELRILEMVSPFRFQFTNGLQGEIYGVELSGDCQALRWWRLRGGYTWLRRDLYPFPGHVEFPQPGNQGNDPAWHAVVQSFMDLPRDFEINAAAFLMDYLPAPHTSGYFSFDLGAAWRWKGLEVSVYGRNLAEESHPEARISNSLSPHEIPRSVIARLAWRM